MSESLYLGLLAFAGSMVFGPLWLRFLRRYRLGKRISVYEPSGHLPKAGTPTMGGVTFLAPAAALTAGFNLSGRLSMLLPLAVILSCATLGAVDDLIEVLGRRRAGGLRVWQMLSAQLAISLVAAATAYYLLGMSRIHIPFVGLLHIPGLLYVPFAALVMVSTINAVALSDGLDGLASGLALLSFAAFWVISLYRGQLFLATFCATMVGALLAWLWFNGFPAVMFMGNTGSLALGATLGAVALIAQEPFLLFVISVVFVATALSVIVQILSVKLRGKRVFRFAPIHRHFELAGWPEQRIVTRFWILGAVASLLGVLLAIRY
jgi:phospho-N-acetylmuramoyl-pentapeptide-transferase